jgi:hypothetical protein
MLIGAAVALVGHAGAADAQPRDPISRYVIDLRGATSSLPTTEGWTPTIAGGADVPGRGFGVDVSAHLYPLRLGPATIGLGAGWTRAAGRVEPNPQLAPTGARPVTTSLTAISPQVSVNFGHRMGWSYVSGGVGQAHVESTPEREPVVAGDWSKTVNYGGGARWFIRDRLAVGFDLRFHQLSPRPPTATRPGGGRIKQMVIGIGVSVR